MQNNIAIGIALFGHSLGAKLAHAHVVPKAGTRKGQRAVAVFAALHLLHALRRNDLRDGGRLHQHVVGRDGREGSGGQLLPIVDIKGEPS